MLLGPAMDTFEARADCQANKLTLTQGRERTVQDSACTLIHGPIYKFSKKVNSFSAEILILSFHFASREDLSKMKREDRDFRCERIHFFENL